MSSSTRSSSRRRKVTAIGQAHVPARASTAEELAIQAQAGSVAAFDLLVRLFEDRVYNFLLRRLRAQDAEDITQDTFIRAWQRIQQYQPRWKFSTWLFTIAARLAATHARSSRVLLNTDQTPEVIHRRDPSAGLSSAESRSRIWRLVDEVLTIEQRTAIWLRYVEGLSTPEIGEVMGKSRVAVRVMLHRARGVLAAGLQSEVASAAEPHFENTSTGLLPRGDAITGEVQGVTR